MHTTTKVTIGSGGHVIIAFARMHVTSRAGPRLVLFGSGWRKRGIAVRVSSCYSNCRWFTVLSLANSPVILSDGKKVKAALWPAALCGYSRNDVYAGLVIPRASNGSFFALCFEFWRWGFLSSLTIAICNKKKFRRVRSLVVRNYTVPLVLNKFYFGPLLWILQFSVFIFGR